MKQTIISNSGATLIIGVTIIGFLILGLIYNFGPAAQQQKNMMIAQAHGDKLMLQLSSDQRFQSIRFKAGTSEELLVLGVVNASNDLSVLNKIIRESEPPCGIQIFVRIFDEQFTND